MLRVGLTGGIAAGKSTVAGRLVDRGAVLVDADVLAREVVAPGTGGLAAVVDAFGTGILTPDGALDRPRLARLVFADAGHRRRLNAIVHPRVAALAEQRFRAAAPDAIVVHDVPLLVENGLGANYHLVVLVTAPEATRIDRLVRQRGMTAEQARARVYAQADDDQRRAAADAWLENTAEAADLIEAVDRLWDDRLVAYEANLRRGLPAPRDPRPRHPTAPDAHTAARVTARIARVAGVRARFVDRVGRTPLPGLDGPDVLDVQVVVDDLVVAAALAQDLTGAGLVRAAGAWWDETAELGTGRPIRAAKEVAVNADPACRVDCHIRPWSSPVWRNARAGCPAAADS